MIDEATYNELKKYTEPQPHRDAWLSELGYIEATDLHVRQFRITAQGLLALREYEQYAERNRLEDDRYAQESNRQIKASKTSIILTALATIFGAVAAVTGTIQLILSFR